jgi:hypothetical protein
LRHIDPALWRRVKAKAAERGHSIRALIEALLRVWLDDDDVLPKPP